MSDEFAFRPPIEEQVEENKEPSNIGEDVRRVKSLFNINSDMGNVHSQLTELARRVERMEQKLPSSFIPQYRIKNDKEYTPLGGVLDKVFDQIDDLYSKLEQAQEEFNKSMYQTSKEIDGTIN